MRTRYAVVADDLTGAGDTGAQFAAAGLAVRALLGNWTAEDAEGADVLVVNTDSRPLPPDRAAERVRAAAASLAAAGVPPFFKKVDSTLRGALGAEVDALMDEARLSCALVCPAFPANGRLVVGGYLLVEGVPVARGAAGRDPVTPVRESHVPSLLAGQSRRPVSACSLRDLEAGRLPALIAEAKRTGGLVVCDAASDADLAAVAGAAWDDPAGILFVGAAGLGGAVAARLSGGTPRRTPTRKPVLVLVGSVHPTAREQARRLAARGDRVLTLSPEDLLGPGSGESLGRAAREALAAAGEGRTALVLTAAEPGDLDRARTLGRGKGLDEAGTAAAVAGALASVAKAFVEARPDAGLVATGGDVARAVLGAFGSGALDVLGETAPGIPVCSLRGGAAPGLRMVTKAGGFGKPEALERAADLLAE